MENNIDLILAHLHVEEEELLLLVGLAFVQSQRGVPKRRRQGHRRRRWIKHYLHRGPLFEQYENLIFVLYRENRKDDEQIWFNPEKILVGYQNFLRIKPDLFQEFVERT